MADKKHLELTLELGIRAMKLPIPEKEFMFHPTRKWRFDLAWPELKIAAEIEGGTWGQGKSRHTTGSGFHGDCLKYNEAALLGWRVLRGDAMMVRNGSLLAAIERAIFKFGA